MPKRENAFWSKAPSWWAVNELVWTSAFQNLSKLYIRYSIYSFIISLFSVISFLNSCAIAVSIAVASILFFAAVYKNHGYMQKTFYRNGVKK